jgi:hypothetical protein
MTTKTSVFVLTGYFGSGVTSDGAHFVWFDAPAVGQLYRRLSGSRTDICVTVLMLDAADQLHTFQIDLPQHFDSERGQIVRAEIEAGNTTPIDELRAMVWSGLAYDPEKVSPAVLDILTQRMPSFRGQDQTNLYYAIRDHALADFRRRLGEPRIEKYLAQAQWSCVYGGRAAATDEAHNQPARPVIGKQEAGYQSVRTRGASERGRFSQRA